MGTAVTLVTPDPNSGADRLAGTSANPLSIASSASDRAALSQTFKRSAAVGATAGDGLWVSGVTTAGPITIGLVNGGSITANVPLGSSMLQFGATSVNMGAIGGSAVSLFFT